MRIQDEDQLNECKQAYKEVCNRFESWDSNQDPHNEYEWYLGSEESVTDLEDYGCLLTLEQFILATAFRDFEANSERSEDYVSYYDSYQQRIRFA